MPSPEPSCVNKTADWRLKILQNGLYLIYGQVVPNTAYNGLSPFEVQLRKNEDPIQALNQQLYDPECRRGHLISTLEM